VKFLVLARFIVSAPSLVAWIALKHSVCAH
jgi:hypothetical protein